MTRKKNPDKNDSDFFSSVKAGLDEALAHQRGQKTRVRVTKFSETDIKKLRKKLDMSQNEFAQAYGLPVGNLRNWEQGHRRPPAIALAYLKIIAKDPVFVRNALRQ
jgi:putative transcriptional regulator